MSLLRTSLLIALLTLPLVGCDSFGENDLTADVRRLFPVQIDGRWGYINAEGRIIVEPVFREAGPFVEDRARARLNGKRGFLNPSGTFISEPNFDRTRNFSNGLAAVRLEGKWGYIDRSGRVVIDPQFKKAGPFSEGRAFVFNQENDWTYIDLLGKVKRTENTPELREIEESTFSDGLALIKNRGGSHGFINHDGEPVIAPQFSAAKAFSEGYAAVKISDRWGYIDKNKVFAINPKYIAAGHFSEGLAPVRENTNTWGYTNRKGEMVIAPQFEDARAFSQGRAAVMLNGRWGYIDTAGAWILDAEFAEVGDFQLGLGRIRLDVGEASRYGYVDRAGRYVWFPSD